MVVRSANSWRLVMDRAYGKVERPDHFKEVGQSFVIRLRDNAHLEKLRSLRRQVLSDSSIVRDITCQLGRSNTVPQSIIVFFHTQG